MPMSDSIQAVHYRNEQNADAGIPDRYRNKGTPGIRMLVTRLRCRNADAGGIYPSMPMPSYAIKYFKKS
jgi:hypothetical protein